MKHHSVVTFVGGTIVILIILIIARIGCAYYYGTDGDIIKTQTETPEDKNKKMEKKDKKQQKVVKKSRKAPKAKKKFSMKVISKGRIIDITANYFLIKYGKLERKYLFSDKTIVYNIDKTESNKQMLDVCQIVDVKSQKDNKKYAAKIYILKMGDCFQ